MFIHYCTVYVHFFLTYQYRILLCYYIIEKKIPNSFPGVSPIQKSRSTNTLAGMNIVSFYATLEQIGVEAQASVSLAAEEVKVKNVMFTEILMVLGTQTEKPSGL